jgi:uncharacterized protein
MNRALDLADRSTSVAQRCRRWLAWIVLLPVVAYRRVLSPMKRVPSCRFLPTCSEYAIEAVKERGVVVGGALATWRVLRCNPLCHGGYDPVPGAGPVKDH